MSSRRTIVTLLLLTVVAEAVALAAIYFSWQGNPREMARRIGAMQVRMLRQAGERLINEVERKVLSLANLPSLAQVPTGPIDWPALNAEMNAARLESLEVQRYDQAGTLILQSPPTNSRYPVLTDAERASLARWAQEKSNLGGLLVEMPQAENLGPGAVLRYTMPIWRLAPGDTGERRLADGFLCAWLRTSTVFYDYLVPSHLLPSESYTFVLYAESRRDQQPGSAALLWHSSEGQWLDTNRSKTGQQFLQEVLAVSERLLDRGEDYEVVLMPRRVGQPREEILASVPIIFGTRRWLLFQSTPYSVATEYTGLPTDSVLYLGAALALLPAIVLIVSTLSSLVTADVQAKSRLSGLDQYRELFAENPTGMLVLADAGQIVECNHSAERLLGVSQQEAVGQKVQDYFEGEDAGQLLRRIHTEKYLHARDVTLTRRQDRVVLLVEMWGRILGDRTILMCQDVQQRRSLEQQVSRLKRMESVGGLVSTLAHDFNSALGQVQILLSNARAEGPPDAPWQGELAAAEDRIDHAAKLIADLQALREETLSSQPVQLVDILRRFAAQYRRLLPANVLLGLELSEATLPAVSMAEPAIVRILNNLCGNAVDAMPYGGRLTLKAYGKELAGGALPKQIEPGMFAVVEVADTGTGVPQKVLDNIFEPFFSTKRAGKGSGLGLWTVYRLLSRSGGWIDVQSQEGKGSTFTMYFPAARNIMPTAPDDDQSEEQMGPANRLESASSLQIPSTVAKAAE